MQAFLYVAAETGELATEAEFNGGLARSRAIYAHS